MVETLPEKWSGACGRRSRRRWRRAPRDWGSRGAEEAP